MIGSLKKKFLPVAIATAMASGAMLSNTANAIHLAEDGIGQVLMAPIFLAIPGYNTKFAIVNTRSDTAVKAKVVFRSQVTSAEIIDFVCYLTPSDVCRFEVQYILDTDRNSDTFNEVVPTIVSSDDSMKSTGSEFASLVPISQPIFTHNLGIGDTSGIGHVEVIGTYGVRGTIQTPEGPVRIQQGMSKVDLAKIFDSIRSETTRVRNPITLELEEAEGTLVKLNSAEREATGRQFSTGCLSQANAIAAEIPGEPCIADNVSVKANGGNIRSTDPTWVRLLGYVEMVGGDNADRIGYRIPALAGELWDNTGVTNFSTGNPLTPESAHDGRVIANHKFDTVLQVESGIGAGFGLNGIDNIIEIEHALSVTNIKGSYEDDANGTNGINRTQLVVTFPTKYRHIGDVCNSGEPTPVIGNRYYPPFNFDGNVGIALESYDNQENGVSIAGKVFSGGRNKEQTFLGSEVNYFLPAWPKTTDKQNFESGWFDMTLIPAKGCSYTGIPTLSYSHKYQLLDGKIANSWFIANGHTPELANRGFALRPAQGQ